MSGNEEREEKETFRVCIGENIRLGSGIPAVCSFCGHFGAVIDVEILDINRFLITCGFCKKSSEVKEVRN